jgi:hypothetical protein
MSAIFSRSSPRRPAGPPLSARAKRWLYLTHRWAGIVLCLFFAMWFLSGMVMMYVGYPKLAQQERLAHLAPLDAAALSVTPAQAVAAARGGAPVYLVPGGRREAPKVVDAATGALLPRADAAVARATAAAWFGGRYAAHYGGTVDEDVYTHSRALDADRPLHRVDMEDPERTRLYISSATGMVVLDATRAERLWNYAGAWIHWLYPLRGNALDPWWHDIVVWLSVAGVLVALTGTVVGVLRWRFSRPYASGSRSPYRESMMRWHHLSGLLFAAITITWVFSGLMSMNPWKLFTGDAAPLALAAYAGEPEAGPPLASPGALIAALPAPPRELVWARVDGRDLALARSGPGAARRPMSSTQRRCAPPPSGCCPARRCAASKCWTPMTSTTTRAMRMRCWAISKSRCRPGGWSSAIRKPPGSTWIRARARCWGGRTAAPAPAAGCSRSCTVGTGTACWTAARSGTPC